jgi:AcrR family transcriptional regulator
MATMPMARAGALTEEEILGAALEIIEEDGVDGLTMRRLSSRLGVALGATYHHVKNKDALLVLASHSLFARVEIPALDDRRDWSVQVREVLLGVMDVFSDQSELVAWQLAHPEHAAPSEIMIRMRGMLANAGLGPDATEDALASLYFYVAGALIGGFTMARNARQTGALRRQFERGLDIVPSGIRAELQPS